jgi:DNA-directed RNA polymerase specialized sigma24 family protein
VDKRQVRAFEGFAAESGAELLRIATLLTSDPHTAEDVYQETLQRLAARWSRVDNPKAFCRRVMANIVIDQTRARARRPREMQLFDWSDRTDPQSADPHAAVELRPALRLVGISVGAVKSTASRAIAHLRAHPGLAAIFTTTDNMLREGTTDASHR